MATRSLVGRPSSWRENSLTTLLCILLSALLARRLALLFFCTGFCCILAAAAIESPEAPERKVRFSAEENSLTVFSLSSFNVNSSFTSLVMTQCRAFVVGEQVEDEESSGFLLWGERSRVRLISNLSCCFRAPARNASDSKPRRSGQPSGQPHSASLSPS
jgi:hypothetical protein